MKHWTECSASEYKEQYIADLVITGMQFSKYLRFNKTHMVSNDNFPGKRTNLRFLASLYKGDRPLVNWENVADLNQFVRVYEDQGNWSEERWEKEIRERMS